MFNPKQALERIRKSKQEKQQNSDILNQSHNTYALFPEDSPQSYNQPINVPIIKSIPYQSRQKPSQSLQQRMLKLQALVSNLSERLTQSNQVVQQLKVQNSNLQTHILKLQNQNQNLKSSQKYSELKHTQSYRLNSSVSGLSENYNRQIGNFHNDKSLIKRLDSKVIEDQIFSPEVEDAMDEIKKQPIGNILKRKQQNFRALKNASKDSLAKGQKALRQLANLHKNYGKHYKKQTLIINLEDADFE